MTPTTTPTPTSIEEQMKSEPWRLVPAQVAELLHAEPAVYAGPTKAAHLTGHRIPTLQLPLNFAEPTPSAASAPHYVMRLPDHIVVLDVEDMDWFESSRAFGGAFDPNTFTVQTPRGRHFYYRVPHAPDIEGATMVIPSITSVGSAFARPLWPRVRHEFLVETVGCDLITSSGVGYVCLPLSPGYRVLRPAPVAVLPVAFWALIYAALDPSSVVD